MIAAKSRFVAMSCLCVGVGVGGSTSMLAKITLIDIEGNVLYSKHVAPTHAVVDYRFSTTGLRPEDLKSPTAARFDEVQPVVASILKERVLIGHSLWLDLSVLGIPHPAKCTRDVSLYLPFRGPLKSTSPTIGLHTLLWQFLRRKVTSNHTDTLATARAVLDLYLAFAEDWEAKIEGGKWPSALPPCTFSRCFI